METVKTLAGNSIKTSGSLLGKHKSLTQRETEKAKRKSKKEDISVQVYDPCSTCVKCPLKPSPTDDSNEVSTPVWTPQKLHNRVLKKNYENDRCIVFLIGAPFSNTSLLDQTADSLLSEWIDKYTKAAKVRLIPVVKCPYQRLAPKKAIKACQDRLRQDLYHMNPDVIVCLGKDAAVPFNLSGQVKNLYNRVYSVNPIETFDSNTGKVDRQHRTQECKLIVTYEPVKFVEDVKVRSSVEAAIAQAERLSINKNIEAPENYYMTDTPEEFSEWVDRHINDPRLNKLVHAFDIETNGRSPHPKTEFEAKHPPKLRCISFSWAKGMALCVPVERDYDAYLPILKRFMESDVRFIGHNVSFDYFFLRIVNNIWTKKLVGDTMLMAAIENPGKGKYGYGLKPLAAQHTDLGGYETDMKSIEDEVISHKDEVDPITGKSVPDDISVTKWEKVSMDVMAPYNCADTDATLQIYKMYYEKFKEWGSLPIHIIVTKAIIPLGEMEHNGFLINKKWVDESRDQLNAYVEQWDKELQQLAFEGVLENRKNRGHTKLPTKDDLKEYFDWQSPAKMADLLYNRDMLAYNIPVLEESPNGNRDEDTDASGRPTGDINLAAIGTPFTQTLRKYRRAAKLLSTYFNGYLVNYGLDHRLRADFNLTGTITGRLSSSGDANLQSRRLSVVTQR